MSAGISISAATRGATPGRLVTAVLDSPLLRVLAALLAIAAVFQSQDANFVAPRNFSNLILQVAVIGILAMAVSLVLLIGEIDLSLGSVLGVSAAVRAVLVAQFGVDARVAIVVAIAVGAAIGALHGAIVVMVGVPTFIVTLTGLLAWQGVQIQLLSPQGQVSVQDPFIQAVAGAYLPDLAAWGGAALCVVVYGWLASRARRVRKALGLPIESSRRLLVRIGVAAILAAAAVASLNAYLGVPVPLVMLLVIAVLLTLGTRQTKLGSSIYAIGGNREAARRAGIGVSTVRISVFAIAGGLSAVAGVVAVSRSLSAANTTGGGSLLLMAIAGAVIGGVSLFGGRGLVFMALLGAIVIGAVENGLDLLGGSSSVKYVIEGLILVAAASLDAVRAKRQRG